jgi:5'-phosphate synthase pdxT subunit
VGSGIFLSGNPAKRAEAIVRATTFYDDIDAVTAASRGLGEAMVGISVSELPAPAPARRARLVSPRVGVLALQGGVAEHERMLAGLGATPVPGPPPARAPRPRCPGHPRRGVLGARPPARRRRAERAADRRDPRRAADARPPAPGSSCWPATSRTPRPVSAPLGILDVTVRRNAFGRQVDSAEVEASWSPGPGSPLRAAAIRAPEVTVWGEGVEVVSTMAVAGVERVVGVRQDTVTAIALHPELTGDPTGASGSPHDLRPRPLGLAQRSKTSSSRAWVTAGSPTALAPPPRIPRAAQGAWGRSPAGRRCRAGAPRATRPPRRGTGDIDIARRLGGGGEGESPDVPRLEALADEVGVDPAVAGVRARVHRRQPDGPVSAWLSRPGPKVSWRLRVMTRSGRWRRIAPAISRRRGIPYSIVPSDQSPNSTRSTPTTAALARSSSARAGAASIGSMPSIPASPRVSR